MGGTTGSITDVIDYITIATLGNAIDFGNLLENRGNMSAVASSTRAVGGGGNTPSYSNVIQYVQIMTTGDAVDFGDLSTPHSEMGGISNGHGGL
jgi:hypothetical protein